MRKLLVACAAAGSLLLGAGGVAASQGLAEAATTDQMVCDYAFVNGICDMGQVQAGDAAHAGALTGLLSLPR